MKYTVHPYESADIMVKKYSDPFNYIIIDNLFNQEIYQKLCATFPSFISRTTRYKDQPGATSDYEGYISGLGPKDLVNGYDFFASKPLQNFVEQSFNIKTSQYISPSAHFHKAPSKNGFMHRDANICSFPKVINNDAFITSGGGVTYTDDSIYNASSVKMIRSIALLYYLNNDQSDKCSGGGTGIYNKANNLINTIEPKNNRLFIFEISYNSFHGFIGANFDRSAIVSWFHSSPAYIVHRNWESFRTHPHYIERWTQKKPEEYWPIEHDPEYSLYFNQPLKEIIKQ
jgi:hypothetical protein